MSVSYKQQMHDGPRSMETQLFLMTQNAQQLSKAVMEMLDLFMECRTADHVRVREDLQLQMQCTNRRILETDIFMSGYQIKE